ncbi:MAG: hypothetical protein O6952_04540, partial [Planctomycetota bacterium]|nr:hypothetical protein [Planctomycetota bacterium]
LSSVREDGKRRVAEVKLHRGVEGEYQFTLSIEKVDPAFPGQGATLEVPRMALRGARTERGVLSLTLSPDLRAKVSSATGATQVDVADLGEQAKGAAFGFRYPLHPFTVQLEVEKVQPRVRADSLSIISIDDEQVVLTARYVFQIQRGGLFHLRFILPAGYDLIDATSSLAVRDSRVVDAPEGKVLEVDLEQRTTGGVDLTISLESRRESAEGNISLPFIEALEVIQETGHVGVSLLESLEAVTGEVVGLVPKDPQQIARGGIGWPQDQVLTQGFSYQKHPISADLKVSRKESHVTATVQTSLDVKEDLIKVTSEIHYDVRYAGVDRFRFTLPKGVGETAHIEGALTKEKRSEETDEGTTVVREVTLQRKVLGSYVLTVEFDLKLAPAEAGESVTQEIPELTVLDVFSEEGYVAVRKAPNIVLQVEDPTNTNLDSIDPRELPKSMREDGAFLAYQYLRHPVAMNVAVTRYEFKSVLPTLVRRIHTEVVLTTEGALRYEATIALINKHRQFLRVRLPVGAEVEALSVDGEDRDYSKDEGEVILVDLAEAGKQGKEIRIRLRYNIPRTSPGGLGAARRHRVLLPAIEGEPAPDGQGNPENPPPVAHLSLNLHVPQDRAYIGFSTSMNLLEGPKSYWGRIRSSLLGGNRIDMRGLRVIQAGESLATMVRGGEANSSGDFVPEGKKFSFFKLEGGGAVTITHLSRPLHAAIQLGVIVGLLAAGLNLPRRKVISANLAVFGLAGITITLLAFAPEPMRPYLESALMSAALLGLIWAGLFVVNELKGGTAGTAAPPLATESPQLPSGGGGPDLDAAAEDKPKRRRTSGRIRKPRRSKGEDE